MHPLYKYYYKQVLVLKRNAKHFWFTKESWKHNGLGLPVYLSFDGNTYAFFYSDPKERNTYKCWILFILFLKDETE